VALATTTQQAQLCRLRLLEIQKSHLKSVNKDSKIFSHHPQSTAAFEHTEKLRSNPIQNNLGRWKHTQKTKSILGDAELSILQQISHFLWKKWPESLSEKNREAYSENSCNLRQTLSGDITFNVCDFRNNHNFSDL